MNNKTNKGKILNKLNDNHHKKIKKWDILTEIAETLHKKLGDGLKKFRNRSCWCGSFLRHRQEF